MLGAMDSAPAFDPAQLLRLRVSRLLDYVRAICVVWR